ncbi:WYL domain-containing protein [Streptomyces sp. NPDC059851]|uniref:WYL domain-containing protein n=1 Tax=Streptomyces sp. NPDC059851 TaxID=3346971 RepID=UPI003666A694
MAATLLSPESLVPPNRRDYLAAYDARGLRLQASVRIAPELIAESSDRLDRGLVRAVGSSAGTPDADGWVTASVPLESVGLAVPMLLSLGADVEVLAPEELRRARAATAAVVLDRYRGAGSCHRPEADVLSSSPADTVASSETAASTAKP